MDYDTLYARGHCLLGFRILAEGLVYEAQHPGVYRAMV